MSKTALNKKNLVTLGADVLADLLLEAVKGDAARQRQVRRVLSVDQTPEEGASDIRKRFATLRRATSFISWKGQRTLAKELTDIIDLIETRIAPDAPDLAFDLLWSLLGLSPSLQERTDDSNGTIGSVMGCAMHAIEKLAPHLNLDTATLADQVFEALLDNGYGEYDDAIRALAPAVGNDGLERMKSRAKAFMDAPITAEERARYQGIYGTRKTVEEMARDSRKRKLEMMLQNIADCQGDVDAWLAKYTPEQLTFHTIAPNAARRLLDAGRPEEALKIVRNSLAKQNARDDWFDKRDLDQAHFDCLEALDRKKELKAALWDRFERRLCSESLRRYLKFLPDFDDEEALDRAKAKVLQHSNIYSALVFCIDWPDMALANRLVLSRAEEFDGDVYEMLTPAAERLSENYPLAAVLLWRAMICFSLDAARSKRYGHAARHLAACAIADAEIDDYREHADHNSFLAELRASHGRKSAFWSRVES
ncbi:DUF6880 family protein [Marivita sp.]|uniref:DUF6880 family protein n=1 Tax=Marivita sp. TaxID=2003365 RepID=UPI003B52935C